MVITGLVAWLARSPGARAARDDACSGAGASAAGGSSALGMGASGSGAALGAAAPSGPSRAVSETNPLWGDAQCCWGVTGGRDAGCPSKRGAVGRRARNAWPSRFSSRARMADNPPPCAFNRYG